MPTMPIQYSTELPPGQGPSVRAHLDTDTGAGAMWHQVAQAGSALADLGTRLGVAEDSVALDSLRAKRSALEDAARLTMASMTDPQAMETLRDKTLSDVKALSGPTPGVNRVWRRDMAEWEPRAVLDFSMPILRQRQENVKTEFQANALGFLRSGHLDDYNASVDRMMDPRVGVITQAEGSRMKAEGPAQSTLEQAKLGFNTGQPAQYETSLDNLSKLDTSKLSSAQQDEYNHLVKAGKADLHAIQRQNFSEGWDYITEIQEASTRADATSAHNTALAEYKKLHDTRAIDDHQYKVYLASAEAELNKKLKGDKVETDPVTWRHLKELAKPLSHDSASSTVDTVKAVYDDAVTKSQISTAEYKELNNFLDEQVKVRPRDETEERRKVDAMASNSVEAQHIKLNLGPEAHAILKTQADNWVTLHPGATGAEIDAAVADMVPAIVGMPAKQPKSTTTDPVGHILGMIETGQTTGGLMGSIITVEELAGMLSQRDKEGNLIPGGRIVTPRQVLLGEIARSTHRFTPDELKAIMTTLDRRYPGPEPLPEHLQGQLQAAPAPSTTQGLPHPRSKAEFDALPSETVYERENGTRGRKP
jgi:hypothetical protein